MTLLLRNTSLALGILATILLVYDAFKIVRALRISASPKMETAAFTASPAASDAHLLVLGDSTAVGTGAADPKLSVAGRIGTAIPALRVENNARDGARISDLQTQLASADSPLYDAILIQVAGNDILQWTSLQAVDARLDAALAAATGRARQVVLIVPGLVGNAPAVPWPLSIVLNHRARTVRQRCREIAARHDVEFVDVNSPVTGSGSIAEDPGPIYAADGLHPSAYGYARWYQALRDQSSLLDALRNAAGGTAATKRHGDCKSRGDCRMQTPIDRRTRGAA